MNAPAKKWSMKEAWLGATISGPLGTFSAPYDSARKKTTAIQTVITRTSS